MKLRLGITSNAAEWRLNGRRALRRRRRGKKSDRDLAYEAAMAKTYAAFPDLETTLFYALSIYGSIPKGAKGFEKIDRA
ncbi:MAG: hypothetical protein NVS2B3_09050 [Vulcanimicrobiaceae bacterium]